jgi:uncharacterized pyridoxamine 5'-phosphate oxidase family protein
MDDMEKKIWRILGRKLTAALATVSDAGAPWVRYVTIESGSDFTLRFCTSASSRKVGHMAGNPAVHLACGNLQPPDDSVFLQVVGRAEICSILKVRTIPITSWSLSILPGSNTTAPVPSFRRYGKAVAKDDMKRSACTHFSAPISLSSGFSRFRSLG